MDERLADAAVATSALSWMAMGLRHDLAAGIPRQRSTIAALRLCVAALFLTRAPPRRSGTVRQRAFVLPAVTTGGLAMAASAPWAAWPAFATFGLLRRRPPSVRAIGRRCPPSGG